MSGWMLSHLVPLALFAATVSAAVTLAWLRGRRAPRHQLAVAAGVLVVVAASWVATSEPYDLRKLAGACAMPAGLVWLGLLALAVRLRRGASARLAAAAWLLWIGFTLAGNVWVAHFLTGWLERDFSAIDPMQLSGFDAILVLGGGIAVHDHGQLCLSEAGDRVMLAARLYHAGKTDTLVTSGPFIPRAPEHASTVPAMTSLAWQDVGVAAEDVVLVEGPRSTTEEVEALAPLVASRSWQRVGLLTSAYHLPRALALCRRHGLTVTPIPANFLSTGLEPRPMHVVPQSEGFRAVQKVCWEVLGRAVGR